MTDRNIKYTSDGKKVLVVGKLNAEQTIVQEIFVSNGQEIPSGENFVVSSLHDAPVESWKEKSLREAEERYDRESKSWKRRLEQMTDKMRAAEAKAKLRASALFQFALNADDRQLDRLRAFMAGEITHFFVASSHSPAIFTWDDDSAYQRDIGGFGDARPPEALKLVSLFGSSNGDLTYKLGRYSDGSGGSSAEIVPCCGYDEALQEAQRMLDRLAAEYVEAEEGKGGLHIAAWQKIAGIVIPEAAAAKMARAQEAARQAKIAKLREELRELTERDT